MGLDARLLTLNRSQEELEAELLAIQSEMMGGKTLTHWGVGDSSAEKSMWLNFPPAIRLRAVAEALSVLDPVTYLPDLVQACQQTRPTF